MRLSTVSDSVASDLVSPRLSWGRAQSPARFNVCGQAIGYHRTVEETTQLLRLSLMKKAEVKLGGGEDTMAANHPQTVVSSW
jgi:hypothetical protein